MDFGTVMSVAQTLFAALQSPHLKEMYSLLGYKSELEELSRTISTVRAVLLDAEAKQLELSQETKLWIEELKDAVYDADDLLDEFVTLSEQKQLIKGGKNQLRLLFSRLNPLRVAYSVSQGVKKISKKLDIIASNHSRYGLSLDYKPITFHRREETCSYTCDKIIGREQDVENIVQVLLGSDIRQQAVSILPIVGIGGLGKTALAQLVYNDSRVIKEFPLRLWTCVSDQGQRQLDIKMILGKVLELAIGPQHDGSSMEFLQSRLREQLAGRKFLIVLDDVWTEDCIEWRKFAGFLMGGQSGSWIVVTTRSRETARIVRSASPAYELQGLSYENSWCLFQMMAFEQELRQSQLKSYDNEFVKIGQGIVKRCANVPLAVKVLGSLLYGQDKSKWLAVEQNAYANIRASQNGIMPILKLSYLNLEPSLKSCFSYCALFPKDFQIKRETLISLWMAQGYIVPLDEGQSIEDAGEEHFLILLRRCFFHEVVMDEYGEIVSCKMHDLMHDVAQEVAGKDICTTNLIDADKRFRHLSIVSSECPKYSLTKNHLRTCLRLAMFSPPSRADQNFVDSLLTKSMRLRALDWRWSGIKDLPSSIGKLLHLRYLNLSYNDLEVIPKSITTLYNLKSLRLRGCANLKELPKDLSRLVNLRILDIKGCSGLAYMPLGMDKLSHLHTLPLFIVGGRDSTSKHRDQLEGLKTLDNLKGSIMIDIRFAKNAHCVEDIIREGAYLRNKKQLNEIWFHCKHEEASGRADYNEKLLLEELQPHFNLRGLSLIGYRGGRLPQWAMQDSFVSCLPNLVKLELCDCRELSCLPPLNKLHHLKFLRLEKLPNLEYIENNKLSVASESSILEEVYFPSLVQLDLYDLPKLKGWTLGFVDSSSRRKIHQPPLSYSCLSRLKSLYIHECPELTYIPECSSLEDLYLHHFSGRLQIINEENESEAVEEATTSMFSDCSSSSSSSRLLDCPTRFSKLKRVDSDNVAWLRSLPAEAFQSLTKMVIFGDQEVESLSEVEQVFSSCSSSLESLEIWMCPKLRSLSGGLDHLSALRTVFLSNIPIVALAAVKEDSVPWHSLHKSLQSLSIWDCRELQSLPNWMLKFTSLRQLTVRGCSQALYERCNNPSGQDSPNIQHIPLTDIKTTWT